MKLEQLFYILIAAAGICLTLLFPPNTDVSKDYTFFWNVPKGNIDVEDLIVRLVIFITVPGILFFIFREKKIKRQQKFHPLISASIIILGGAIVLWWGDKSIWDIADFLFLTAVAGTVVYSYLMQKKQQNGGV